MAGRHVWTVSCRRAVTLPVILSPSWPLVCPCQFQECPSWPAFRPGLYKARFQKKARFSRSFRNVGKMWVFTKRGFVQKRPFRDGAEKRPKFTNCAHKAAGKACICHIDEGMSQHPSRVSHSFHRAPPLWQQDDDVASMPHLFIV